jgi:type VI secretion system secreted protein VgrG
MAYAQTNRRIGISTPLGKDVLLLRGFTGAEAISQLFNFDLDLLSESDSIKFDDIVGKNVTLRIFDANGAERHWNGFISRFAQGSQNGRFTAYRAQVVPWLWFLSRTADCRIFQNKKVPEIIQQIFTDLGFKDFELRLYGDFSKRDYCVQYRETDLNFVSRLMEEEGICYYFAHKSNKHVLILANDPAAHDPCPNQATVRYDFRGGSIPYEDVVTEWHFQEEFRPGSWAQTDYNFETPSTSLAVSVSGKNPYEIYEFPGEHRVRAEGDKLARIRLQEQTVHASVSQGVSGCRYFSSGFHFTLKDHYRNDLNQTYLLTAVRHQASEGGDYEVGSGGKEELSYKNTFDCIPFSVQFRPPRVTPQPFVQGCQTAVVVGPAGEEIYTDKHGRVKVQFHWDREGKKNENSSCWIRVSHPWAGKGYGSLAIPRIGQEVIVDFVEGDPDCPIITGRVYNAEQMPHTNLPASGMVSGFKSNSTPGGGGYNEISMDDTKGKEKVTIHGQYDVNTTVEHDDSQTVKNNRNITVSGTHTETVKGAVTETYKASHKTAVTSDRGITVDGTHTETIKGAVTENYKASQTTTVNQAIAVTSETAHIYIHTATSIQLQVGASKLWMAANGDISLEGVNVTISGSSLVTVKGQIVHSEATAEHQTKGAIVISDGSATNTVKGGMVMLNP